MSRYFSLSQRSLYSLVVVFPSVSSHAIDSENNFSVSVGLRILDFPSKWNYIYIIFYVWLLSFSLVALRFIHILVYSSFPIFELPSMIQASGIFLDTNDAILNMLYLFIKLLPFNLSVYLFISRKV